MALLAAVAIVAAFAWVNVRIYRELFSPPRSVTTTEVPMLMHAEEVDFTTADGVKLQGLFIGGEGVAPAIVFCHDRGQDRGAVMRLALRHNRHGFAALIFDFRAHGRSGGEHTTFGIKEREDVVAAVRYLASRADVARDRVGVWGVGMGAYAALLAAPGLDESVHALALCFLYRDPRAIVKREFERASRSRMSILEEPYLDAFERLAETPVDGTLPERTIGKVGGRSVLFVVGEDEPESRDFVVDELYGALDSVHRSLLELSRSRIPDEGTDTELFENNSVLFFKQALAPADETPSGASRS